jgi:hypothetical protein
MFGNKTPRKIYGLTWRIDFFVCIIAKVHLSHPVSPKRAVVEKTIKTCVPLGQTTSGIHVIFAVTCINSSSSQFISPLPRP